jgi:hypothetical protein
VSPVADGFSFEQPQMITPKLKLITVSQHLMRSLSVINWNMLFIAMVDNTTICLKATLGHFDRERKAESMFVEFDDLRWYKLLDNLNY